MRKPSRQRYVNAVHHIQEDQVPFQESDPDICLVNQLLGTDFPRHLHSYELPPEMIVKLHTQMCNEMAYVAYMWELGRKNSLDATGRKHYVDGMIKHKNDLKDIWYPDRDVVRRRFEGVSELLRGTGLGLICSCTPVPRLVALAMGYETYMIALMDDPDFIREFHTRVEDYCRWELETALTCGADVIQFPLDVCMKSGPMYSPDILQEFEFPYLRRNIETVHRAGAKVLLHADGYITPLLNDIIAMGIDILNPIEPCNGQDIRQIKTEYGGRIALQGNIDLSKVLAKGTPSEVRRDVIEHIEALSTGGGYIVASSHNVSEAVSLENFQAMRDAACSYTRGDVDL